MSDASGISLRVPTLVGFVKIRNTHSLVVVVTGTAYVAVFRSTISGQHNNQNQIWCVNIGEYMVFGFMVGSEYCGICPPRHVIDNTARRLCVVVVAQKVAESSASRLRRPSEPQALTGSWMLDVKWKAVFSAGWTNLGAA